MFSLPVWAKTFLVGIVILVVGFGFGYLYCQKSNALHQVKALAQQVVITRTNQSAVDVIPIAADAKANLDQQKIQTKFITVTKEVYIYVKNNKDASSPIGSDWVRVHDAAATDPSEFTASSPKSNQLSASAPQ